jgi:hypothetical protein
MLGESCRLSALLARGLFIYLLKWGSWVGAGRVETEAVGRHCACGNARVESAGLSDHAVLSVVVLRSAHCGVGVKCGCGAVSGSGVNNWTLSLIVCVVCECARRSHWSQCPGIFTWRVHSERAAPWPWPWRRRRKDTRYAPPSPLLPVFWSIFYYIRSPDMGGMEGYWGIQRDTAGYSGMQRHTIKILSRARG